MTGRKELYELVLKIPAGRCAGYGALGRYLTNPVSGYITGKWMGSAPPGVPWWRVAAKDGSLVVGRRDPRLAQEQRQRLESEGVPFEDDRVAMDSVRWDPFEELG